MQLFSLMPFLPLAGFLILAVWGKRMREPLPGLIASGAVLLAFLIALAGFVGLHGATGPSRQVFWDFLPYLGGNGRNLPIAFRFDQLSAIMTLVVTGVGFLIHVYSIGYMHANKGYSRFFAYLNFFVALMLVLVLADSYPVMFIGWEGVGVASYLLIGFEYQDFKNTDAGRKAFIVNRIGDLFFVLGMGLAFHAFGSLNIQDVSAGARATAYGAPVVELIGLFMLLGAAGKSAQLPLSTWLPDAMAGPTPVSALIHAATMVTAGVYLIARSGALFTQAPGASSWVAWVGAFTALYGALSAIAQTDIKKILAYSTISQLGFMFIAVGSGVYWVGVFHVVTHAFFKALLFLAAGSVIHGLSGEQDVRKMGGLAKLMPTTHIVSLVGVLAISGIPILAGFWSKDAILGSAFASPLLGASGPFIWFIGVVTAVLTAAYMWRWYVLVFQGKQRVSRRVHESPAVMTLPLWVLAGLSVVGGFIGLPGYFPKAWNILQPYLERAIPSAPGFQDVSTLTEVLLVLMAIVAAVGGLLLAAWWYRQQGAEGLGNVQGGFGEASRRALYLDDAYRVGLNVPASAIATGLAFGDTNVVDAGFNGLAGVIDDAGAAVRGWESGYLRSYAVTVLAGAAVLIAYWAVRSLL